MAALKEIHSVTEFQLNIQEYLGQLKKDKIPLVVTVNGRAELVVQDAESYQLMLDRLEKAETVSAIRRAVEQFDREEGIPLDEAEKLLRPETSISLLRFSCLNEVQ